MRTSEFIKLCKIVFLSEDGSKLLQELVNLNVEVSLLGTDKHSTEYLVGRHGAIHDILQAVKMHDLDFRQILENERLEDMRQESEKNKDPYLED